MAKYSDIKGFTVQTLSTDTVASQQLGGSWSSGGSLNTARRDAGGAGTQTAAQSFFGLNPAPTSLAINEYYDGSSWSEQADGNTARGYGGGLGQTQTASLLAGGFASTSRNETEVWNGSSWTEVNNINTARENLCNSTAGSSTSGLIFGGYAGGAVAITEEWDGSSWTESGDLNSAKYEVAGTGTQTAAISAGGNPRQTNVEQYNGSSWTEITDVNTARTGSSAAGLYTDTIVFGGNIAPGGTNTAKTEFWNGTSWTELSDLSAAKTLGNTGMGTTTSSSLYFAGISPAPAIVGTTEEWTAPSTFNQITEGQLFFNSTTNTFKETITDFPAATWASGGSLNTARDGLLGGAGTQSAGQVVGGRGPSGPGDNQAVNELYDGTSFTESADLNTARRFLTVFGATNTASVTAGGYTTTESADTETWDGSSFTESGNLNNARYQLYSSGTSTAGLAFSGDPGNVGYTETWNGSAWTEVADLNTGRGTAGGCGIQTSTLAFGGVAGGSERDETESWDGTSWTEVSDLNTAREKPGGSGASADVCLAFGGDPPRTVNTEFWNGTSWTEVNNLSTGRGSGGTSHNSASATFLAGGRTGTPLTLTANTEEWTADLANKTITAS